MLHQEVGQPNVPNLKGLSIYLPYYDNSFAFVVTKNWSTDFFALQIGLFQGYCMSVMIFNVVFQMLLDYHSQFCHRKRIGYAFKNAQITVVNPSFADDITLAASDANDCQQSRYQHNARNCDLDKNYVIQS